MIYRFYTYILGSLFLVAVLALQIPQGEATMERAIWEQGIRKPLAEGAKRHEWKAAHGFRKFYKSRAEQIMRPINVEITMGHNIGISASYYRPTEQDVLEDYLKAIDLLTVNGDKVLLQKQVEEL